MANAYILNQLPTSYGAAMSLLTEMLAGAGWTYQGSGDGTSTFAPPPTSSTVTISNASPAVVSWTSHGLQIGVGVKFTTNGTLPSPLVPSTTYYIVAAGFGANSFEIATAPGGTAINTTTPGSGTHTATSLGNIFTTTGSGANGWNNGQAWARMQDPAGVREFIFQHNAGGLIRIKYSPLAKFTGTINGAVSATLAPTATDEKYAAGIQGPTGAFYQPGSPASFFSSGTTVGATIYQGAAIGTAPYGFWFAAADYPRGAMRTGIMWDPVTSVPEDPDPYVITVGSSNAFQSNASSWLRDGGNSNNWNILPSSSNEGSWAFMDTARTQYLYVQPSAYSFGGTTGSSFAMDFGIPNNPFNGNPEALPLLYARYQPPGTSFYTQSAGVKGWSTMAKFTGTSRANLVDTLQSKSFIAVGAVWLPWDGTTTPLG